ncbi:nuclear pore glycoprotein p62-like [Mytilus trossulus]|uniref:nuclear pore glycoprotein p62-like n=1 Tax=Mytilus trossulus TaxID=6551 RepID=UPI0030041C22
MFGGNNPPTGTTSFSSTTKPSGFSFGSPAVSSTPGGAGGGFSFGGAPQSTPSSGTPGFGFGGTTAPTPTSVPPPGYSFGGATQATAGFSAGGTTTQPAAGFSLGGATTQPAAGFSLGGATTQPTAGFSLGGATSQPSAGFSLGGATTQPAAGFSLSGAANQPAAGGFSLGGITTQTSAPGFSAAGSTVTHPSATNTAQPAGGLNLTRPTGQATAQPTGGFNLSSQPTVGLGGLTRPVQPSAVQPTSTSAPGLFGGGLKLGTAPASATTSSTQPANLGVAAGFSLSGATTSAAPSLGGVEKAKTATVGFSLPTTVAASSGTAAVPQKQMNYQQLEENINKWMQDLEKQEKEFLEQATHVNAWDRLLVENGEKITCLNSDMERVKVEQQKLDHELDFIKSQQRELEEMLNPLEKSVEEQPNISFQQHADLERENTYQLAENVDAQLKRMLQDLKEIIDHLNTSNASQDNTDPIFQITQILNSHMDSLQWIDQNSAVLKRHVEDISKQMESQRKQEEKNFRLVYQ